MTNRSVLVCNVFDLEWKRTVISYKHYRGGYRGFWGCTPLFRNDFVPLSLANFVCSYTMEGFKKCPIYYCTPSLKN
jgi:hypothetical protein